MFCKNGVLKNFAIFKENSCVGVSLQAFRYSILLIPILLTPTLMYSCEYCETLKNTILKNICGRLPLILWTRIEITQAKKVKSMEIYGSSISETDRVAKENSKKQHANLNKCWVENCPALPGRNLISTCFGGWDLILMDGVKFHPGTPGSCNPHLRETHRLTYKMSNSFVYKFVVDCQVF